MSDLDSIAREIADDTFAASHVPEMNSRLRETILAALRRVEAETREECAKAVECDCCDVCGESPGYPKCSNEIASDIRAIRSSIPKDSQS